MVDRLEALLEHFSVSARVFNTGALCGITELDAGDSGRMHLVRACLLYTSDAADD